LRKSRHIRLFHNLEGVKEGWFIILYIAIICPKLSELKKSSAKVKISNLVNYYSTVYCRNRSDTKKNLGHCRIDNGGTQGAQNPFSLIHTSWAHGGLSIEWLGRGKEGGVGNKSLWVPKLVGPKMSILYIYIIYLFII